MFGSEKIWCHFQYDNLINLKKGISYIIYDNYAKTKIDSADDLPLEKTLILCNVAILIEPVLNKNQNQYYYRSSDQLAKYRITKIFFDRIITLGFGKTKVAK